MATPCGSYEDLLSGLCALVQGVEQQFGQEGSVGIGMPGAESLATGLVKNANSTVLNGHPLAADVSRALGRAVRVANDANCFALSEAVDGAGAGEQTVFGVILGTGVGGGIVVDGRIWTGRNSIAGEWGHNEMPAQVAGGLPATRCYCGRTGCVETYLSGPALAVEHGGATGRLGPAPNEIATLARVGEPIAAASLERFYERLACALASVINVHDPDTIVLGGGLSNLDEIYREVLLRLPRYVFSDVVTTPVVKNRHGDSSGVRRAA